MKKNINSNKNISQNDTVTDLFNQKAANWSKKYSFPLSTRLSAFKSLLIEFKANHKTLLDVGCATGPMLIMAHELGFDVSGIDLSPKMVEVCKKNLSSLITEDKIKCGTLEDYAQELPKFDVIICSSVFEYLDRPLLYLEIFNNLLNANGIVLITIPNTKSITRFIESLFKKISGLVPFLVYLHPKIKNYLTYIHTSKNRYSDKYFRNIISAQKYVLRKKVFISKNRVTNYNNLINSNMILYALEKQQ